MQSMCNNFVSQFDAELSQLKGEAAGESNGFVKAQEIWSQEKASMEAEKEALRASYKVSAFYHVLLPSTASGMQI